MRVVVAPILLIALLPLISGELVPETIPRPSTKGFSTINGVCDTGSGIMANERYTGKAGTLTACSKRCAQVPSCKGFNFFTDNQQCTLFDNACDNTNPVGKAQPTQNFYLKGEIACTTSTVGQEFYVAFMANRVAQPKNMDLEIWLTQDSSRTPSTVNIQIHDSMTGSWKAGATTDAIQVPFKKAVRFAIPYTWKVSDIDVGVSIEKKALKLSSDTDFVLYGVNKEYFTSDAFLGIPSRALSTRYVVQCFWPPFYNCEFAITPTADNTHIRITLPKAGASRNDGQWEAPPTQSKQGNGNNPVVKCAVIYNGQTYTNGDSFNITLNEYDVAQIQDPCDLTSTIIESDKQIAVWSGDSRSNIGETPNRDHLVEQLFSTDTWGTECAAWPTPSRTPGHNDYWIITAAQDNTVVTINSNERSTFSYTLNNGESVRFPANSVTEWMRFTANGKFQAVQECHSTKDESIPGDPSMTLCIPTDQFGFGYTFVTPTGVSSNYTNYLTIITGNGNQNGFTLDGNDLSGVTWNPIPNSRLVGGYVLLDSSQKQQFRIEHKVKGTTFEAYIYGAGNRESVAYPTGACIKALGTCVKSTMFISDGKDNDCDGAIDEELFDGIDNDFDGLIDEDCYARKAVDVDRCPKVLNVTACYGSQLQLSCDDGTIAVLDAHLGRLGRSADQTCGENAVDSCSSSDADCGFADVSNAVGAQCQGQQKCSVPVNYYSMGNLFAPSRCPTCSLYAFVQYSCLNAKEQTFGVLSGKKRAASSWLAASGLGPSCSAGSSVGTIGCADCANSVAKTMDTYHPAQSAFTTDTVRGWRPATCDKDSSWLQVDLGGHYSVGWYAISGCRRDDYWVTSFAIAHSQDGSKWTTITDSTGAPRRFDGNVDAANVKVCTLFALNIVARWVRIMPLSYNGYPCAHVDFGHNATVQGCSAKAVANSNFAKGGTAGAGTPATVKCNRGWSTASGAMSYDVQCNADGSWSGEFRDCNKLLFCPDVPQIDGGYANARNNLVGSTVNFGCLGGRRLRGASSATCQDNGKWSDAAPTCDQ